MADCSERLRKENQRLREEIQHFQRILRETDNAEGRKTQKSHREALVEDIEMKLERGIFSPPKAPKSFSRRKSLSRTKVCRTRRGKKQVSSRELTISSTIQREISSDLTRIETSLGAIHAQDPDFRSELQQEIAALRESLAALLATKEKRTLRDSFESYYNSERENLETRGRPELSFEEYERRQEKGERRRNRALAEKIRTLQSENDRLKSRLGGRKATAGRSRTLTCHSKLRTHCRSCDFLLSRGLSTTRCKKHCAERPQANCTFSPQ